MKIKNLLKTALIAASFTILVSCNGNTPSASQNEEPSSSQSSSSSSTTSEFYKVKVEYPDGTVAKNLKIQWCNDAGTCYGSMATTGEDGVATTTDSQILADTGNLQVHIYKNTIPSGYTFNPFELVQNKNSREGIIHLYALNDSNVITGTADSPYEASLGYYLVNPKKNSTESIFFEIELIEAGTYVFESYADTDPLISFRGNSEASLDKATSDNDGNSKNFKLELEISAENASKNLKYLFAIQQKASYAESFAFSITKKAN